jgi:hypothetical protein
MCLAADVRAVARQAFVDHPDHRKDRARVGMVVDPANPYRVMGDDHLSTLEQLRNQEVGGVGRG